MVDQRRTNKDGKKEIFAGCGIYSGSDEAWILAAEYDAALNEGKSEQEAQHAAITATRATMGQGREVVRAASSAWIHAVGTGRRPEPGKFRTAGGAGAWSGHVSRDRNPLVAAAYDANPDLVSRAAEQGPEPTLFSAGDLPDFTASGVDPKVLLQVPWNARPKLAAETDKAQLFEAVELFNGIEDAHEAELVAKDHHLESPAVYEYQRRVNDWVASGMTDDELMVHVGFEVPGDASSLGKKLNASSDPEGLFKRLGW